MIQITGVDRTIRVNRAQAVKDGKNIAEGLSKAADMILKRSDRYVPKQTHQLQLTGRKESNGKAGFNAVVTVTYGGPAAPYAMIVHERTEVSHASPTCAKYLERAARELRGSIVAMLKRQVLYGKSS